MSDETSKATIVLGGLNVVIVNSIFFEFTRNHVSCVLELVFRLVIDD